MTVETRSLTLGVSYHPGPIGHTTGATLLARALEVVMGWSARAAQRRHLSGLTLRELDDVGIGIAAAAAESAKPFWRA